MLLRNANASFLFSVVLHIVVLMLLIISFEFSSSMPVVENSDKDMKIIDAVVMDSQPQAVPEPAPPTPAPPVPQPPPQPVKPDPEVQKQQQAIELKKQEAIALNEKRKKKLAAEKALQKQLLDDLKKQTKKDKLAKAAALEKAMEKELKDHATKSLQQQLLQAQKQASGAKARGEVNKYKALILQAIGRRWLVPAGVDKTLSSQLLIRVAPGGMVLDVQITKSSGDVALDRSARDAVFKASPLPVPEDADAFDQFRQFVLKVKPENIGVADVGQG